MSIFSSLRKWFGSIKVEEDGDEIHVLGVDTEVMEKDIQKLFNTSKIATHIFTRSTGSSFSFNRFFALDVLYMLDLLIESRSGSFLKTLDAIKTGIQTETWVKNTLPNPSHKGRLDFSKLSNLKFKPLKHQQEFLDHYNKEVDRLGLNGMLAALAAGLGKTILSLQIAECVSSDKIIVICPKVATERVWEKTVLEIYNKPRTYWMLFKGKKYNNEDILIVHYEAIPKLLELLKYNRSLRNGNVTVILDESHNLNEITAQRTIGFIELCKATGSRNIIALSGTPIKAMGAEMIPLLRVFDPLFTEKAAEIFKKIFGKEGNKGLDILKNRLGLISYKVEKSAINLSKPIIHSLPIKMPTGSEYTLTAIQKVMEAFIKERAEYYKSREKSDKAFWDECQAIHRRSSPNIKEYNKYLNALNKVLTTKDTRIVAEEIVLTNQYERKYIEPTLPQEYIKRFRDVKSVIKYVKLKIQGECLGRVLGRMRIDCHVDMSKQIDYRTILEGTLKKTVIFTSFVDVVDSCNAYLREKGFDPLIVYGSTTKELNSIVQRFDKDDHNPLIATYASLSTAVPLTMADRMIMINPPFRAYIEEQAISRIHRIGADTQTNVFRCVLDTGKEANISTRSKDILEWSQQMVEQITGVKNPFVDDKTITELNKPSLEDFNPITYGYKLLGIEPVFSPIVKPKFMSI